MRSLRDRIRHAVSFEVFALLLFIPLSALVFGHSMEDMGVVGLVSSLLATGWNILYNRLFDGWMQRRFGTTLKTVKLRVMHAALFELGLMTVLAPFIAVYLNVSLWEAAVIDLAASGFYFTYAFAFNWAYDALFPLPEWKTET